MVKLSQRPIVNILDAMALLGGVTFSAFIVWGVMGTELSSVQADVAQIGSAVFLLLWALLAFAEMRGAGWKSSAVRRVGLPAWPMLMLAPLSGWFGPF